MEGNTYYWGNEVSLGNELEKIFALPSGKVWSNVNYHRMFQCRIKIIAVALEHFYYSN